MRSADSPGDASNGCVAPVDESDTVTLLQTLGIGTFQQYALVEPHRLLAHLGVLRMALHGLAVRVDAVFQDERHGVLLQQSSVARCHGVDHATVHRPDLVPLHVDVGARGSLRDDELLETLDGQATAQDTAYSGETRIIPAGQGTMEKIRQHLLEFRRRACIRQDKLKAG